MRGLPRIAIFMLSLILLLGLSAVFWNWIPDDAYISFEYARNLAEGEGLVFNPGERVEGFSNLLWTLLLALVARLGGSIELVARAASLMAASISLWLSLILLSKVLESNGANVERGEGPILIGSMIASATFFPLAFYSTAGLETTFYVCCLLLGAVCHLQAVTRRESSCHYPSLFAFLAAALSRPEGIAFLVLNVAFVVSKRRRGESPGPPVAAILVITFYAAVMILKQHYFGSIVPNTYFAKPGASLQYLEPIGRGLRYLVRFFGTNGAIFLLPFAFFVPHKGDGRYIWIYLWSFAACQLAFIVFVGADVLRFDRFAVPLFPWLIALAALGVSQALSMERGRAIFAKRSFVFAVAVIICLSGFRAHRAHSKFCEHDWMHAQTHREIGRFLGAIGNSFPESGAIVTNEIGAIRYHSRRPVIDMLGLTDATISAIRYASFNTYGIGSSAWSAVSVSRYLFDREPAYVLLPSARLISFDDRTRHQPTMHPLWYAILTEPRLESQYRGACAFKTHENKYLYLFVRNDIDVDLRQEDLPQRRCLETQPFSP
jgi:hypothetical protein